MSDLLDHFNKSQPYLRLGDNDTFNGLYISWEPIKTKFGKNGYRFILEREDGSRLSWDCGNMDAIKQFGALIRGGMKKGDLVKILRQGTEKDDTKYTITAGIPF
jgi:hypothetical protein